MNQSKRIALLACFAVLLGALNCAATEDEFFGTFSHKSKDFSLEFEWTIDGITNLKVAGVSYPGPIKYDNYGIFGNTAFYRIVVEESRSTVKDVELLVLFNKGKVLHVSAVYADVVFRESRTGDFDVRFIRTFEMKFKPARTDMKER